MTKILELLEKAGFTLTPVDFGNGNTGYQASKYTPAGEDWSFSVWDVDDFIQMAEDFDIDEEVGRWLDAKRAGVSGVPSVLVLVDDAKWKLNTLNEIVSEIKEH